LGTAGNVGSSFERRLWECIANFLDLSIQAFRLQALIGTYGSATFNFLFDGLAPDYCTFFRGKLAIAENELEDIPF